MSAKTKTELNRSGVVQKWNSVNGALDRCGKFIGDWGNYSAEMFWLEIFTEGFTKESWTALICMKLIA